jgi:hypothetical protein
MHIKKYNPLDNIPKITQKKDKPRINLKALTRYSINKMRKAGISMNYNEILTLYKFFVGIFYQDLCKGEINIDNFGKFCKHGNDFSIDLDNKIQKLILSNLTDDSRTYDPNKS